MTRSKITDAIAALDKISAADPEGAHSEADKLLLSLVPPDVRAAYERVTARAAWWGCA